MYDELPDALKNQVRKFLLNDNFRAAKEIYDNWRASQKQDDCNRSPGCQN